MITYLDQPVLVDEPRVFTSYDFVEEVYKWREANQSEENRGRVLSVDGDGLAKVGDNHKVDRFEPPVMATIAVTDFSDRYCFDCGLCMQ